MLGRLLKHYACNDHVRKVGVITLKRNDILVYIRYAVCLCNQFMYISQTLGVSCFHVALIATFESMKAPLIQEAPIHTRQITMLGVCQNAVLDPNFDVVVNLTTAAHIWVQNTFCNRTLHGLGSLLRSRQFSSN